LSAAWGPWASAGGSGSGGTCTRRGGGVWCASRGRLCAFDQPQPPRGARGAVAPLGCPAAGCCCHRAEGTFGGRWSRTTPPAQPGRQRAGSTPTEMSVMVPNFLNIARTSSSSKS
jgi:hypothetical protein